MALDAQERSYIEARIANEGKSAPVAYILLVLAWFVSGHRFYLGRPGTAVLQILSYLVVVGFIWLIVDLFLIPGMVREKNEELRQKLTLDALTHVSTPDRPHPKAYANEPASPEHWEPSEAARGLIEAPGR